MVEIENKSVKGSTSGRPIMLLLDLLGRRWSLRILWELREERLTFRELQQRCDNISPTMLNKRIKELRQLNILDSETSGYGFTKWGDELGEHLVELSTWSNRWAKEAIP